MLGFAAYTVEVAEHDQRVLDRLGRFGKANQLCAGLQIQQLLGHLPEGLRLRRRISRFRGELVQGLFL